MELRLRLLDVTFAHWDGGNSIWPFTVVGWQAANYHRLVVKCVQLACGRAVPKGPSFRKENTHPLEEGLNESKLFPEGKKTFEVQ